VLIGNELHRKPVQLRGIPRTRNVQQQPSAHAPC